MWEIILLILSVVFYLLHKRIIKNKNVWEEKGVPCVPSHYLFGNFTQVVFRISALSDVLHKIYSMYPDKRYVGFYQLTKPILLLRDTELIKKITVKDFEHFSDHTMYIPPDIDPLWGKNLLSLSVKDGWHDMRATLSPSFTSSKMRIIFALVQECTKKFVKHLDEKGEEVITMEAKDAFSRFSNDVIGSAAFGVTCNSLKDRDNGFYVMGKALSNFSGIRGLTFFAYSTFPKLAKFFGLRIVTKRMSLFFKGLITATLKYRQEKNIIRPDMIHLLLEARKGVGQDDNENDIHSGYAAVNESEITKLTKRQKLNLSDEDITAHALIFFFAGFETTSTAISFLAYEIAIQEDVQTRLYDEIVETLKKGNNEISYESLLSMKYLDLVVSESLRLHPPATFIDRKCVKPYVIDAERPGEVPLHLERNSLIWVSVRQIHRDPQYYSSPEKFDPDRFSNENKHNIKPFSYLPFGLGPRNCIGSRFALLEIKLVIVELLKKYQFVTVTKTEIPIKLSAKTPLPVAENGIWIGLKRRK